MKYSIVIMTLLIFMARITSSLGILPQFQTKISSHQPLSMDSFSCGTYLVAAKLTTKNTGKDYLVFYPSSEREFEVPVQGLSVNQSQDYFGVGGIFKVKKTKNHFSFQQLVKVATLSQIYFHPVQLLESEPSC